MKADKGNCFVVMDRIDCNEKMENLLSDHQTYQLVHKPPFAKIERELNHDLLDLKKKGKIDDPTYYKLRSTDAIPPAIRGSIKHHKAGLPLRPIVSCIGFALYNTIKFLTDILTPIQNLNGYSVSNSMDFTKQVANQEIADDEVMVSFDVVSLFTAIPVDKACDYIRKKLDEDTTLNLRTTLNTDKIISLLEFTLSNNYFMLNDSVFKQIHGCAMGSPVSPVVANLCMEAIEESAIAASTTPPKVWKRYVDDSFVIIKKHSVSKFYDTLNAVDPKISLTLETENNGQISFLDTLITRKNGTITIGVYRKPTHTDGYLDFNSHHELKHKLSTASTLLNRAINLPSTSEEVKKELTHVSNALKSNGYPSATISNILKTTSTPEIIPFPEELVGMFFRLIDPPDSQNGFAVLPYIKGLTEPLTRILNKNGIRATTRPVKTLQQEFVSPKSRPPSDRQTNVVYKIPCADCTWSYIGETSRCLHTRNGTYSKHQSF